jgi:hypothetical protein
VAVIVPEAGQSTIACLLETVPQPTVSKCTYLPPATRALKASGVVSCEIVSVQLWQSRHGYCRYDSNSPRPL